MLVKPFADKNSKLIFWIVAFIAAVYVSIESQDQDDYFIYISGAHDLFAGENIYTKIYNEWYHYLYSVFFAIVLYPLSLLPFYVSKFIWLSVNVYFLYRIFVLIFDYIEVNGLMPKQKKWFFVLSVLFCLRFIVDNFHCGQITVFLVYLSLQGLALIRKQKLFYGALLIALGINIKLMPIVLLPYLIYRKQLKASVLIVLFCLVMIILPSFIIGHARNMELLGTWWGMMNPQNTKHIIDVEDRSFHSISTLFATYLTDTPIDPYGYGTKINFMHLSVQKLGLLINMARGIVILGMFWFLRSMPFVNKENKLETLWEISYLLAVIPLIFPHQHHYAFICFLPASVYLLHYVFTKVLTKNKKTFFIVSLSLVYIAFNLQLLLGEIRPFLEHFKILSFGALYMLVVLALAKPIHGEKIKE